MYGHSKILRGEALRKANEEMAQKRSAIAFHSKPVPLSEIPPRRTTTAGGNVVSRTEEHDYRSQA
jgi:hypothetical protein